MGFDWKRREEENGTYGFDTRWVKYHNEQQWELQKINIDSEMNEK